MNENEEMKRPPQPSTPGHALGHPCLPSAMSDPAPRPTGSTSLPIVDAPTHHDLVPPPVAPIPQPAGVAARARAQAPPSRPTRVPFFANAAQPEIGQPNGPYRLVDACSHSAGSPSEPEGPLLPEPVDGAI